MSSTTRSADPYRRRREAGAASRDETRRRLLASADTQFREHGYAATTVTAIAAGAGVSLQTLYLAWGSKAALFKAAAEAAAAASAAPVEPDAWRAAAVAELAEDAGHGAGTRGYLAAISRILVRVVARTARYRQIYHEAAATDAEIAVDWREVTAASRRTMLAVAATIPPEGLRPELSDSAVADTLWAVASPEMYDLLTGRGGYTAATFETWLRRTLNNALCSDGESAQPNQPRRDGRP